MCKKTKGFTLIEQVLAVALLVIVIMIAGIGAYRTINTHRIQRQILDDHNSIRLALLNLTRDINHRDRAEDILIDPSGNLIEFKTLQGYTIEYSLVSIGGGGAPYRFTRTVYPSSNTHQIPHYPAVLSAINLEEDDSWLHIEFVGIGFADAAAQTLNATISLERLVALP